MVFRLVVFSLVLFLTNLASAHCLQSFNGYGPVYAPSVLLRTQTFMKQIVKDGCEVIHLQEVWNKSQINKIEEVIDLSYLAYAPNKMKRNGLMSFSHWNVLKTEYHSFDMNKDGGFLDKSRSFFGVEKGFAVQWIMTPAGEMAFVNLHLHPTSPTVRIAQILQLIVWRMKVAKYPIVLTGDFNMTPDSLEHFLVGTGLRVKDAMQELRGKYTKDICTYCASNRLGWLPDDRVLDYFFYTENSPIKITNVEINLKGTPEQPLSDHFGLKVSFDFTAPPQIKRDIQNETQLLVEVLDKAKRRVALDWTQESVIYKILELWKQELTNKQGGFWAYFMDQTETVNEIKVSQASGLNE